MKKSVVVTALMFTMILSCFNSSAFGVILSSKAELNLTRPGDSEGGTAWDLQGDFGRYSGTPIASQYFLAADHTRVPNTTPFVLNGVSYTVDTSFGIGGKMVNGDLALYKINEQFPQWATLYNADEVGKEILIFGKGVARGGAVYEQTTGTNQLCGWQWGSTLDGTPRSWGKNVVDGIFNTYDSLVFDFDQNGIANEGALSFGDSGGGVFIKAGNTWALAGINYFVTPGGDTLGGKAYKTSLTGTDFNGAIFDSTGLYVNNGMHEYSLSEVEYDEFGQRIIKPQYGAASRVSTQLDWIGIFVPASELRTIPEPSTCMFLLMSLFGLLRFRRSRA